MNVGGLVDITYLDTTPFVLKGQKTGAQPRKRVFMNPDLETAFLGTTFWARDEGSCATGGSWSSSAMICVTNFGGWSDKEEGDRLGEQFVLQQLCTCFSLRASVTFLILSALAVKCCSPPNPLSHGLI